MNQFKRAKVVLLPTNLLSNISLSNKTNNLVYNSNKHDTLSMFTNQHLHVISNDEIKEGDWVTDGIKVIQASSKLVDSQTLVNRRKWKKIIATTDISLGLPQPSQQFIEKYIESYNKGNIITDVLVEYEDKFIGKCIPDENGCHCYDKNIVKINPKDNTITIKKLKENWNREEVIELLNKLNNTLNIGSDLTLEQWIEKNL